MALHDEDERLVGAFRLGAKPPSSPTLVLWPASCSAFFSAWKISAPMRSAFAEARRADRHDHEFLEVDRIVGVRAAIDDVHQRHRQHCARGAADIAVERQARRSAPPPSRPPATRRGWHWRPAGLVRRAVEFAHHAVDARLVLGVHARDGVEDLAIDRVDGLLDALAAIALAAIAQFHRLVRAGRGARRHRGAAEGAVLQPHIDFHRGIAAAVEDFAGDDVDDRGHSISSLQDGVFRPRRLLREGLNCIKRQGVARWRRRRSGMRKILMLSGAALLAMSGRGRSPVR